MIGLFLATAAIQLMGCAGFGVPLERPTVSPRGMSVQRASLTGLSGALDLSVYNPNGVGLPLRAIEYELAIGGARAVRGQASLDAQIPARAEAPVTVGLVLDAIDAVQASRQLAAGRRDYVVSGTLVFATRVGDLRVGFDHAGELQGGSVGRSFGGALQAR